MDVDLLRGKLPENLMAEACTTTVKLSEDERFRLFRKYADCKDIAIVEVLEMIIFSPHTVLDSLMTSLSC